MAALAKVNEFRREAVAVQPAELVSIAPTCAQCKTSMGLQRVDSDPFSAKELQTYVCDTCGLVDRLDVSPAAPAIVHARSATSIDSI